MIRDLGMYHDNINPTGYKNFGATGYGQGFYEQGFNEGVRPGTALPDANDRFEQTGFDVNDREEEDFGVNDREDEHFDVNDRADDDFEANDRFDDVEVPEQSASTVATVSTASAEEDKPVVKNLEERKITSTGVYNYEDFMEKPGGSPYVDQFITYRNMKNSPKKRR
jgi:hypothetical protein